MIEGLRYAFPKTMKMKWKTVAYAMRPVAAKVRSFAKDILARQN
jgi:hypothetical protein